MSAREAVTPHPDPFQIPAIIDRLKYRLEEIDRDSHNDLDDDQKSALLDEAEQFAAEIKWLQSILDDAPIILATDLFGTFEPPQFPVELLPEPVSQYAEDQGDLIGVDPGIIGLTALGAASACIDDRIQIQPKRYDPTWTESARIWVGIVGDPSTKKSPALKKALAPCFKIDTRLRRETSKSLAGWEDEKKELKKLKKEDTLPPEPMHMRLIVSDCTVEKLGDILSKCEPRGILVFNDELSGWLASHDAYRNGVGGKDKAAWLESFNGGPKAIDRISRGSTYVENWSACVIGGIQPTVIHDYQKSANHDGLLQRFLLYQAAPGDMGKDRPPDMAAKEAFTALFEQLHSLKRPGGYDAVTLSEEAHKVREALDHKLHSFVSSNRNGFLTAALGKWSGLFARLTLVYHCIDCASRSVYPTDETVSGETAQRVADLLWQCLLSHAVKFYEGFDKAEDTAREIAGLILAHKLERITKRDLTQNAKRIRRLYQNAPWEVHNALDRLCDYFWLKPEPGTVDDKGHTRAYLVNTDVHRMFRDHAEKERERRKQVAEAMHELRKC